MKFIQIDSDGYFAFGENRIDDPAAGKKLFSKLEFSEKGALQTSIDGTTAIVEAYDQPIVATDIERVGDDWFVTAKYDYRTAIQLGRDQMSLRLDPWDRFHGLTENGMPFVLNRSAQARFFDLLEGFDDTGVILDGQRFEVPDWMEPNYVPDGVEFWSQIYQNETPRWELEEPASALRDVLPQIKLPRAKVLVLGCGSGNDAEFFARNGHIVTGVDFSPEAIELAKQKYGSTTDLNFVQGDIFKLPESFTESFDVVFEHTCYCAVNPIKRKSLAHLWKRLLKPGGNLLGIFFVHPKFTGPPYGGSEWEIKKRLEKEKFEFLYWTRWRNSIARRQGKELVVLASKPQ